MQDSPGSRWRILSTELAGLLVSRLSRAHEVRLVQLASARATSSKTSSDWLPEEPWRRQCGVCVCVCVCLSACVFARTLAKRTRRLAVSADQEQADESKPRAASQGERPRRASQEEQHPGVPATTSGPQPEERPSWKLCHLVSLFARDQHELVAAAMSGSFGAC